MVGRFVYDVPTDTWWWSDGVYLIHGFRPGEVVPSTALIDAHRHPEDQESLNSLARRLLKEHGEPFSVHQRILDARRQERTVLVAGHGLVDEAGTVHQLRGHLVDLTAARREYGRRDVDRAVTDFAEHRAVIEQAKGVLLQMLSIDADEAFALLSTYSQRGNIKVRRLAELLVDAATHDRTPSKPTNAARAMSVLDAVLDAAGSG